MVNLSYTHYLNERLNITSGFSYFSFGEDVDYSITNYLQSDSTTLITTDSIISINFDTINNIVYFNYYQYDSIIHNLDSTTKEIGSKNRFSYITIPFLFGYNLNYKKLNINLRAGIGYSYLTSKSGQYINYLLTDFEKSLPKRSIFNYIISPTIGYSLNEKFSLIVNPQMIINTKSILTKKGIEQRYKNYGISVGLSYHFSKENSQK